MRSARGWDALRRRKQAEERERGDPRVLGGGEFVEQVLGREAAGRPRACRGVDAILGEVSRERGVGASDILGPSRSRRISSARRAFYVRAHREAGQSMAELARLTGRAQPSVWEAIRLGGGRGKAAEHV